ncbi:MAG TPA: Ig-like domain-containing protein, partial [Gemmataceae bacterium]|nr:Ig-like domain-containing protein [Gemmataceae bacterium]
SPPQTFTITVTPVNDAPRFTKGGNIRLMQENPGPQTVVGWATNIQPGPPNESAQSVAFEIVGNTNPGLFTVAPAVGPTGTLTFVPAPGVHGYSTISVRLKDDGGTANGGQDTSATQSFWIGINPINQAPNFVVGPDQTVPEDAGFQSIPWATGVSAGSPFEADQQLTFEVVSNTNPGLFISGPSVSPAGALLFAPADNLFGSATIIIRLHDDGGTLFGGQDTSAEQSFTITVLSVNDAPSFAVGADRSIAEDAGPHAVSGWATSILAGPANESGQAVTFEVVSNSNPGLFGAGPAVAPDGTLTFMPAPNAFGSATIEIRARDDGGTANGGQDASGSQTFHITVTPVNDAPEFVKGPDPTAREDAGPVSVSGWATGIHPGPTNENSQNVTFEVTGNSHPELFSVTPAVAPDGTLTFTPAADEFGSATITLRLCDDGGTANSGQDTSAEQTFTITVTAVNDAPAFIKGADQTVAEDSGARTVPAWATGLSIGPVNEAGQQLTFEVIGNTRPGLFAAGPTVNAHGTLTFTAAADAFGTATITIQARDDGGTADGGVDVSPAQSFTITVAPVNDAPVAGPDAATTTAGRPSRIPVLANDSDADGDTLTIISFTAPAKGSVRRQGGTLVYTPRNGTSGLDAFAYTVSDGHGGTASANVSVTVKDLTAPKATAIRLYYGDGRSFDVRSATRTVLPWELIRKVEVVFSEEVAVQADSLTVTGLAGAVDMTFAYDPATRTATWAPTAGLGNGRFTFRLARDGVADGSGNLLAADWARSVGLLAGDFNGDGAVSDSDLTAIRRRLGTANRFADIDGNGLVTQADLDLATANRGKRLP